MTIIKRRDFLTTASGILFGIKSAGAQETTSSTITSKDEFKEIVDDLLSHDLTEDQRLTGRILRINDYLSHYRNLLFENAEFLRERKRSGDPNYLDKTIDDVLEIMNQRRIIPQGPDLYELSFSFNSNIQDLERIYALSALEIIDGRPKLAVTTNGLQLLKDLGILEHVNNKWDTYFTKESREKIRTEVQSGKPYNFEYIYKPIMSSDGIFNERIQEHLKKHPDHYIDVIDFNMVEFVLNKYIENRFFEEIPQQHKLVKQLKTIKMYQSAMLEGYIESSNRESPLVIEH